MIDPAVLVVVLQECRELVARSEDSFWTHMTVEDILNELDHAIRRMNDFTRDEIDRLCLLFAPAGPLQETSMNNDWAVEFLMLSRRFDKAIGLSE